METALFTANNVWMMICTALVFFMHLGFSLLEIGLTRQKNTVNILFKNIFIICAGLLLYFVVGFNLMYPGEFNGFLGFGGFGISLPEGGDSIAYAEGGYTYWTDFIFQGMFAATAATIVSGSVAERIKLSSFIIFSIFYVGLIYPIAGSWLWGEGFLDNLGFYDFAGSTIVHSVGGWGALMAVLLLGPRLGKYNAAGKGMVILGHNIPLATAGVFILWLGWFGFNGGSVLSADPSATSLVLVTTSLAAAAGGMGAFLTSSLVYKSLDVSMFLNGILGGLVSITAGADLMSPLEAIAIGFMGGIAVVFAISLIEKWKVDDPVGAIPVHLFCGIWGTLAVGMFGAQAGFSQLLSQFIGIASVGALCCATAYPFLYFLKKYKGIRVSKREEVDGLDIHEHGMRAYNNLDASKSV